MGQHLTYWQIGLSLCHIKALLPDFSNLLMQTLGGDGSDFQ